MKIIIILFLFAIMPSTQATTLEAPQDKLDLYIQEVVGDTICYEDDCYCAGLAKDWTLQNNIQPTNKKYTIEKTNYIIKEKRERGDLLLYQAENNKHIAIYIGNGLILHQNNGLDYANITKELELDFIVLGF